MKKKLDLSYDEKIDSGYCVLVFAEILENGMVQGSTRQGDPDWESTSFSVRTRRLAEFEKALNLKNEKEVKNWLTPYPSREANRVYGKFEEVIEACKQRGVSLVLYRGAGKWDLFTLSRGMWVDPISTTRKPK